MMSLYKTFFKNLHEKVVADIIPENQIQAFTPLLKVGLICPCAQLLHPGIVRLSELVIVSLREVWRVDSTVT